MKQILGSHCEDVICVLVAMENLEIVFRQGSGMM